MKFNIGDKVRINYPYKEDDKIYTIYDDHHTFKREIAYQLIDEYGNYHISLWTQEFLVPVEENSLEIE